VVPNFLIYQRKHNYFRIVLLRRPRNQFRDPSKKSSTQTLISLIKINSFSNNKHANSSLNSTTKWINSRIIKVYWTCRMILMTIRWGRAPHMLMWINCSILVVSNIRMAAIRIWGWLHRYTPWSILAKRVPQHSSMRSTRLKFTRIHRKSLPQNHV